MLPAPQHPDAVPDTGGTPAALRGIRRRPAHYTIYNDTFGADGQPVILSQSNVDISALADVPLSLPQPEAPAYGAYQFLAGSPDMIPLRVSAGRG